MTVITISAEGSGFRVAPVPFDPARPDLSCLRSDLRSARRCAAALKAVKGWRIVERLGGGDGTE